MGWPVVDWPVVDWPVVDCEVSAVSEWVQVASLSALSPGTAAEIVAGDRIVALFNVEGAVYALDGVCPHQGGPLGQGDLEGCVLSCPWHGWQFDVRTGQHQFSASLRQPTLPVRIDGDAIFVDIAASDGGAPDTQG